MPDDASGNFSLVSGYLAVTGQPVQPSNHNPPLEDIAAAMTNRLSRSGVAPMTGPLKTVTGSASVPAIYPNSNPAIGIYWTPTGISFAGSVSGVRFIGELIPYTLLTAPALTVFPCGQTLLRASYPDLWVLAQADIAVGNTFYNNGNGTTTFGIGDLRGRVVAGKDDMGGSNANRLSSVMASTTFGGTGGSQTVAISQANLPSVDFAVNIPAGQGAHGHGYQAAGTGSFNFQEGVTMNGVRNGTASTTSSSTLPAMTGTAASGGSGTGLANVQPTLVCNYLLYAGA